MRTLTIKQGGSSWATGWHTLTVSTSKYGTYNDSKFLELGFADYPENFTLRIYAKKGKDGEEFAIGNVFRFANAGITEVLEGTGGDKVVKLDDSAEQMVNKLLNIFFYKDGEYTLAYSSVAPTVFENGIDTFTERDVDFWKGKAETRFHNYTPGNSSANTNTTDFDAESNLTFDGSTLAVTGDITVSGTVDGADVAAMSTKLSGIEASATADQTDAEIRAAVEAATDSNVFTDADHTKLNAIEASATADQTASEIRTLVDSATDSNVFTDALLTKLNGVETAADVTDATNVDAAGAIMNSDLGTKGQIVVGDGTGDPTILSVGTDGHYLKADSSAASGVAWASVPAGVGGANGVDFNDNVKARFGTGNDLEIFHDGNNGIIKQDALTGLEIMADNFRVQNSAGNETMIAADGDGAVSLYHNDTQVVTTSANGFEIPADNLELRIGAGADLKLYHDGNHSVVQDAGTGHLQLSGSTVTVTKADRAGTLAQFVDGGGVDLYFNGSHTTELNGSSFRIKAAKALELDAGTWTGETAGKIQRHSNHMYFQIPNAGSWIFRNQSGNEYFNISASNGAVTSSNNITAYSDIRLKKDVKTIENALDKVSKLRGVEYTRKSNDVREIGVIAQEVKEIVPELVTIQENDNSINDDGLKNIHTMKYQNTVGLLIEAIKDLKAEIEELKKG